MKAATAARRVLGLGRELIACLRFLRNRRVLPSLRARIVMLERLYEISVRIDSPHRQEEILAFVETILAASGREGVIVEAGCYKGSSTAKFSLAADVVGKELVVFDSFQGIPPNAEPHERNIFGGPAYFRQGQYRASLDEARRNVARFGKIERCRFVPGWFDDTLPRFREKVSSIYLDVDLASSTRTCLKYLYPLLVPGGVLISQDGHLPLVIDVLKDEDFWQREVGCSRPPITGLGRAKLVKIIKPPPAPRSV